jgi:spermidine/putrescine transport system substrate-binding protein
MKKNLLFVCLTITFVFMFTTGGFAADYSKYKAYECPQECLDQVKKEGSRLNIYDWAEWWPEDIFENFSKEYGVKVVRDHYDSTSAMGTKLRLNPDAPYDLILGAGAGSAYQLEELKLLRHFNHDWLPNVDAYLVDEYMNVDWDPGRKFSLPDSIYFTTYAYNSDYVDPNDPHVGSWGLLFDGSSKYAGKITLIDNASEVLGSALKYLGYSYNSINQKEIDEAKSLVLKYKKNIMAFDSWPKRLLVEEEAFITHNWIGDGWLVGQEVPALRNVMPKEGTYYDGNTAFIFKGGKHPAAAHLFMNYVFRTDVNARLVEYIGYPPVHKHVMEFMSDKMKAWPGFIIDPEYMKKCDGFDYRADTGPGKGMRDRAWEEIKN